MCSYWVIWFYTIFSISRVYMNDKLRIFSKLYCWCRQQNYTSINLEKSIRKSLLNMQFSYVFAMFLTLPLSKVSEMVVYFHWPSSIDPNRRFGCSPSFIRFAFHFIFSNMPYIRVLDKLFLAQMSFSDRPSAGPSVHLSVKMSHFHLLLQNYWTNFNQTWCKLSLSKGDSRGLALFQGAIIKK